MNNGFSEKKMTEAIAYYDMKKYKQAEKAFKSFWLRTPGTMRPNSFWRIVILCWTRKMRRKSFVKSLWQRN
ncbi:MAG: hypothetical protein ACOX2X_01815 [Peptococcia bacterium]